MQNLNKGCYSEDINRSKDGTDSMSEYDKDCDIETDINQERTNDKKNVSLNKRKIR